MREQFFPQVFNRIVPYLKEGFFEFWGPSPAAPFLDLRGEPEIQEGDVSLTGGRAKPYPRHLQGSAPEECVLISLGRKGLRRG